MRVYAPKISHVKPAGTYFGGGCRWRQAELRTHKAELRTPLTYILLRSLATYSIMVRLVQSPALFTELMHSVGCLYQSS